jgi:Rrf2 family protein
MLKLTKKADYALIAMRHLAMQSVSNATATTSAKDLADSYGIPQQLLAKILQRLAKAGLVISHQGIHGGYALARTPRTISALEIIEAIDGPMSMTSCHTDPNCVQSVKCTVRDPLRKVNDKIREALLRVKIADMGQDEAVEESHESVAADLVRLI